MDPEKLYYTEEHEWVGEEDGLYVVGISDFAQDQLGDITYVELPESGRAVKQGDETAVVESVKAASDIYAPIDGVIAEVNEELEGEPETVNSDPFGKGWFYKLKDANTDQLAGLMDAAAYKQFLETQE
jgi:glycine cleavage system H protein